MACYYDILGVNKNDNQQIIKKAWHNLSRKFHPDKLDESNRKLGEEKIKEINEAYKVLSDPEKRSVYDRFGKDGLNNNFNSMQNIFRQQTTIPSIEIFVECTLE